MNEKRFPVTCFLCLLSLLACQTGVPGDEGQCELDLGDGDCPSVPTGDLEGSDETAPDSGRLDQQQIEEVRPVDSSVADEELAAEEMADFHETVDLSDLSDGADAGESDMLAPADRGEEPQVEVFPAIIITELHVDPDEKTSPLEYVELFNHTDLDVELAGWELCDGVSFTFPEGAEIESGAYLIVAQDVLEVQSTWGLEGGVVSGPFEGKLRNSGENVALCAPADQLAGLDGPEVDSVSYQQGFPWPTVGDPVPPGIAGSGHSIQLIDVQQDNNLSGSWRSATPTPGAPNLEVFAENIPPHIRQVSHDPQQPSGGDSVHISAKITDDDGVGEVVLSYQVVAPGNYIRYQYADDMNRRHLDPAYETGWVDLPMNDAGEGGDMEALDDIFTVEIPAEVQQHRHLVRYRITLADSPGNSLTVPYGDDPQPNFAYFVYDGVPSWVGSDRPGGLSVEYSEEVMGSLPTYHLISREEDVVECQYEYIDYTSEEAGWYQWTGALVYDGVVYDHIWYRNRGWWSAYEWGKNKWKFDFNRGHYFQARNNEGEPYNETWDKMNLSSCFLPADFNPHRGEHGMFEALTYLLFQLVDVPASNTHWFHFRVVDSEEEYGPTQYDGDFWGLYLAIEQPDGRFLDEHGLPDGNLFKMAGEYTSYTNQGPGHPTDMSDLWSFVEEYQSSPSAAWWEENIEIDSYLSYRTIVSAVHHFDIPDQWNSVYYHHPGDADRGDHWWMLPWDVDLTWDCCIYANDTEAFSQIWYQYTPYWIAFQNRAREVQDLLFNQDQGHQVIDDLSHVIAEAYDGQTFLQAERALWDYHPRNNHVGLFYTNPPGDFSDMIDYMKGFMSASGWGGDNLSVIGNDSDIPRTPSIETADDLGLCDSPFCFTTGPFRDPNGDDTFGAMEWRVGQVDGGRYEIQAVWESGELAVFEESVSVPEGTFESGHTYRVRVRVGDETGRYSHWSSPLSFTAE